MVVDDDLVLFSAAAMIGVTGIDFEALVIADVLFGAAALSFRVLFSLWWCCWFFMLIPTLLLRLIMILML